MKALSILVILNLAIQLAHSEPILNIQGHYDESMRGAPNKHILFRVSLSPNACQIYATNANNPKQWEMVVYDGTNTFELAPITDNYFGSKKGEAVLCGLVSPGRQYYILYRSLASTSIPWVTYCLRPEDITLDMPSSFSPWRSEINTYGWRWTDVTISEDGRFLRGYSIARDKSFDLDDNKEFLRPTYQYPQTLDKLHDQQKKLSYRKSIPDAWICRTYNCNQWYKTNGFTVPAHAEFQLYIYNDGARVLFSSATIQADLITVSEENEWFQTPSLTEQTYVRDYRYTKRDENREFSYAEYVGSESWKPDNDPKLLAEADWYMKHGPKFGEFGPLSMVLNPEGGGRRLILIWLSLLLVSAVAIAMLVRTKLIKRK